MFSNGLWCFLVFCIGSFLNFPKVWSQWCNLFLGMPPFLWCFLMFFLRYLRMFGVNGVICCRKRAPWWFLQEPPITGADTNMDKKGRKQEIPSEITFAKSRQTFTSMFRPSPFSIAHHDMQPLALRIMLKPHFLSSAWIVIYPQCKINEAKKSGVSEEGDTGGKKPGNVYFN